MRTAEELRFLILATQREGNRALAQALRPLGLTPAQAEVIRLLEDHQPLSLSGLGDLLVCESGNSPSRLLGRVVALGLVTRSRAETDGRSVELALTPRGRELARAVADIEKFVYDAIDYALAGYDAEQIVGFLRTLVSELPSGQAIARRAAYDIET